MKYLISSIIVVGIIILYSCQNHHQKIQNIKAFTKLYGYARWFHPSDEAQQIDWDKFAIYGIKKVENLKTKEALRDTLVSLFSPFVYGLRIYNLTNVVNNRTNENTLENTTSNKIVAWQHSGVNLLRDRTRYNSLRANLCKNNNKSYIHRFITDLSDLTGKEIKIRGNFKVLNTVGQTEFYLYPKVEDRKKCLK